MSNFITRILGLAAVATAFACVSFGQLVTCTTAAQSNPTLRAEGQTELLPSLVVTCTNSAATATTGAVYITTSAPITSKSFTVAGAPSNEATLVVTGAGAPVTVQGVVSGNQVSFNLNGTAGTIPASGAAIFTISNIRVNASAASAPQITESGLLTYNVLATTSNSGIPAAAGGPGYVLKTLGGPTLVALGTNNYTTCAGNPGSTVAPPSTSFTLNISELVGGAFLTQAGEVGQVVSGTNIGTASSADIITVTIANVPASATVYVPPSVSFTNGLTTALSIPNSTAVSSGPLAGLVGLTPSSGTVTIPYNVTASGATGAATFAVPVIVQFAANSAAAQGAITATYSYGPSAAALSGPATAVPTFLTSSFTAVTGSTISLCNTTLLFPFVTNQLGFDTGIVLSNTSTDNLGVAGASVAKPQSGTCTLSFYGASAPTPATGVADPQGAESATSPVHAFTASAVAPGFQGYVIASCPFQYAHGFAFITYNLTQNNGVAEGYIAEVLNNSRPVSQTTVTGITVVAGNGTATTTTTSISEPVTF